MLPELLAFISEGFSRDVPDAEFSVAEDDTCDSDCLSIESDSSFDGCDSELDELDELFDEEDDEVFQDFSKSFMDLAFTGKRARFTIMFQVLKLWGLPLLDRTDPSHHSRNQAMPGTKAKKRKLKRKR